jgi:adenylate cyclase
VSDVFISYARSTEREARRVADALRALGYGVWRDDELPAHRSYADVIEERLEKAKAVVVLWSKEATKSEWVQSEADRARRPQAGAALAGRRASADALRPHPVRRPGWLDRRSGDARLGEGGGQRR